VGVLLPALEQRLVQQVSLMTTSAFDEPHYLTNGFATLMRGKSLTCPQVSF